MAQKEMIRIRLKAYDQQVRKDRGDRQAHRR